MRHVSCRRWKHTRTSVHFGARQPKRVKKSSSPHNRPRASQGSSVAPARLIPVCAARAGSRFPPRKLRTHALVLADVYGIPRPHNGYAIADYSRAMWLQALALCNFHMTDAAGARANRGTATHGVTPVTRRAHSKTKAFKKLAFKSGEKTVIGFM